MSGPGSIAQAVKFREDRKPKIQYTPEPPSTTSKEQATTSNISATAPTSAQRAVQLPVLPAEGRPALQPERVKIPENADDLDKDQVNALLVALRKEREDAERTSEARKGLLMELRSRAQNQDLEEKEELVQFSEDFSSSRYWDILSYAYEENGALGIYDRDLARWLLNPAAETVGVPQLSSRFQVLTRIAVHPLRFVQEAAKCVTSAGKPYVFPLEMAEVVRETLAELTAMYLVTRRMDHFYSLGALIFVLRVGHSGTKAMSAAALKKHVEDKAGRISSISIQMGREHFEGFDGISDWPESVRPRPPSPSRVSSRIAIDQCVNCKLRGHYANDCKKPCNWCKRHPKFKNEEEHASKDCKNRKRLRE